MPGRGDTHESLNCDILKPAALEAYRGALAWRRLITSLATVFRYGELILSSTQLRQSRD